MLRVINHPIVMRVVAAALSVLAAMFAFQPLFEPRVPDPGLVAQLYAAQLESVTRVAVIFAVFTVVVVILVSTRSIAPKTARLLVGIDLLLAVLLFGASILDYVRATGNPLYQPTNIFVGALWGIGLTALSLGYVYVEIEVPSTTSASDDAGRPLRAHDV